LIFIAQYLKAACSRIKSPTSWASNITRQKFQALNPETLLTVRSFFAPY
jgi:hypothetical protein